MAINQVKFGDQMVMDITDTTAEAKDVVKGKVFYTKGGERAEGSAEYMDLVSDPTDGNILITDANGQAQDSGVKLSDKQGALVQDTDYYVDAEINGVTIKLATKEYVDSKDPFMLLDFTQAINVSIPYCTENVKNTQIPNVDVIINDTLGENWAIASLAKYEVKNSAGERLNVWPVCMFSMNGQKTLRLRMMCAGTARQTATSIAGAILLKHR